MPRVKKVLIKDEMPNSPEVLVQEPIKKESSRFLTSIKYIYKEHTKKVFGGASIIAIVFLLIIFIKPDSPEEVAQKRIAEAIDKVGEHIVLPEGETPTVATISDLAPLASQPFFANAAIDDVLLIYTVASKAYLYRPSIDRLIEASPLSTDASGN